MSMTRSTLLFAAASLLAACATPPGSAPPAAAGARDGAPQQPAPAAAPSASAPPTAPRAPATPAQKEQAQKLALAAIDPLQRGDEEQAKAEIQRALALDPANALALSLQRQISEDPAALLGRESFTYRVQPGESLSAIAKRFLNDVYAFYGLARYNDIKVPRQLQGGQTIRIPGKAPPPEAQRPPAPPAHDKPAPPAVEKPAPPPPDKPAPPPPPPAPVAPPPPTAGDLAMRSGEAEERKGNLEAAMPHYQRATELDEPGASAKLEKVRKDLVSRHTRAARTAFAKQDLKGAIDAWNRVLAVDPGNDTARLERQKTVDLKKKLEQVK